MYLVNVWSFHLFQAKIAKAISTFKCISNFKSILINK